MTALPGAEIVARGLDDLARHEVTTEALLVSIGAPRLRMLGWAVNQPIADAEHVLFERLRAEHGDGAHSRYNALVRRLVSFERAAAVASHARDR